MNKYKNKKVVTDGILFDSKKEASRYEELVLLRAVGEIDDLRLQVPFELISKQIDERGKTLERACSYVADFVYTDMTTGKTVVEDVKGKRTPDYVIKRKLMLKVYGIKVKEL